jgi:hypothetical protein
VNSNQLFCGRKPKGKLSTTSFKAQVLSTLRE